MGEEDGRYAVHAANALPAVVAALREAREYVAATWGSLRGAVGDNNVVKPSLDRIDAALAQAEGE